MKCKTQRNRRVIAPRLHRRRDRKNSQPKGSPCSPEGATAPSSSAVKEIESAGGSILGARWMREGDEITAFLNDATGTRAGSLHFNIGANVNFRFSRPPSGCSARCGKWPAIPVSCRARGGTADAGGSKGNSFHRRYRLLARRQRLCGLRRREFGLRGGASDGARARTKNIHVAHLIIDSGVDTAWVRERREQMWGREALDNPDLLMPRRGRRVILQLYQQPRSAWTFELESARSEKSVILLMVRSAPSRVSNHEPVEPIFETPRKARLSG